MNLSSRTAASLVLFGTMLLGCSVESLVHDSREPVSSTVNTEWVHGTFRIAPTSSASETSVDVELNGAPPTFHALCYQLILQRRCGHGPSVQLFGGHMPGLSTVFGGPVWCPAPGVSFKMKGFVVPNRSQQEPEGQYYFYDTSESRQCPVTESYKVSLQPLRLEDVCDLCPDPNSVVHESMELSSWVSLK